MRARYIAVFALSVVCLLNANAQTIDEDLSSAMLEKGKLVVKFSAESEFGGHESRLSLDLVDENGVVKSNSSEYVRIKKGRSTYSATLPLDEARSFDLEDLVWYRIRYRLGQAHGIVSVSQLLDDFFEVSVAVTEYVIPGKAFTARVRVNDPFRKKGLPNVDVKAVLDIELDVEEDDSELVIERTGRTDKNGFLNLEFLVPAGTRIDWVSEFTVTASRNGYSREVEADVEALEDGTEVFLTTDKPIYQPGQSFNLRALLFDLSRSVVSDGELDFKIYDEEDTLLYKESVSTSEFGVSSISWQLPENAKLGDYRADVEFEGESIAGGSVHFKVTRYDLPNFAVNAVPDKPYYLPADKTAEIEISADYLFGKPVAEGKVRLVVEKERKWNYRSQKYDVESTKEIEGETDENGKFTGSIDLEEHFDKLGKYSWNRFNDVNLTAYFTDLSTNRTEQKRFDLRITSEPIHVYVLIDGGDPHPELPVTAYVSTYYADGTPALCSFNVEGRNADLANQTYSRIANGTTNRYGVAKVSFKMPGFEDPRDDLDLKITASDRSGATGTFEDEVYVTESEAVSVSAERPILKPGDPIRLKVLTSIPASRVYIDVVQDRSVIASRDVDVEDGRAGVDIPYDPSFSGELEIWAYTEYVSEWETLRIARDRTEVIYPKRKNLFLDARFSSESFKPNEEARIGFSVLDGTGAPARSALGVVVLDKAIEERARTDGLPSNSFSRFSDWLGTSRSVGDITIRSLEELDPTQPLSDDLLIAAEILLAGNQTFYAPEVERSEIDLDRPLWFFRSYFNTQFDPIEKALDLQYRTDFRFPEDEASLEEILTAHGLAFESLTDPWGQKYRVEFSTRRDDLLVKLSSSGGDKIFGTRDDFYVRHLSFKYFRKIGEVINSAAADLRRKDGKFIRDYASLSSELLERGIDVDNLRDPWGRPYLYKFEVNRTNMSVVVNSAGPDGKEEESVWRGDDFNVWKSNADYFSETELKINRILSLDLNDEAWKFPETEEEFWSLLEENGLRRDSVLDGYGRPVYLEIERSERYSDKETKVDGKLTIRPVTEEILQISLRSLGKDGSRGKGEYQDDDFTLATFSSMLTQRFREMSLSSATVRNVVYSGSRGALGGVITDSTGAVIPGAFVTASNPELAIDRTMETDASGRYLFTNLPTGLYKLTAHANYFDTVVYSAIKVRAYSLTEVDFTLEPAGVTMTVDVSSEGVQTINASNAMITTSESLSGASLPQTAVQMQTPRLREYFPETLVWAPEVITDEEGKAELKFRMADNITTWKMYTVASTKNGKIGIAEKEVTAFQPFFADLEPPKFLTTGDEIHLPVQVRNYTASAQPVKVTMDPADWLTMLGETSQEIDVDANASENAVFGFRADRAVEGGKQRITAIARDESDAIEKPVTVRPNGNEVTRSETKMFRREAVFEVNTPGEAIDEGRKTALRIYPNLLANVVDSAKGLLKRPYGCGEQTISSTYPNLMILKLDPPSTELRGEALKFLRMGYERLLGYQVSTGGFTYWGREGTEDIALTAYALRFLKDASAVIEIDEAVVSRAEKWLLSKQRGDGSWTTIYRWESNEHARRTRMITAHVARSLSMQRKAEDRNDELDKALGRALSFLRNGNGEIDEPYALALFGLASHDAGFGSDAREAAGKLREMAIDEKDGAYWKLETNTPFYGWGTAGRIETTALVVQLLSRMEEGPEQDDAVQKGLMFLMRNKDRYGVWYSTQTTINVLDALLAVLKSDKSANEVRTASIVVNGDEIRKLELPRTSELAAVIDVEIPAGPETADSKIEIRVSDGALLMAQVVSTHFLDWSAALEASGAGENRASNQTGSRLLEMDYSCDKLDAEIMEEVTCKVRAERVGFRGYGMLVAEVGIPPGADVSRESLDDAVTGVRGISSYDILPDRVIVYMWANPGGSEFDFSFRPRYGISAQTPASTAYDYYNDEARAVIAPLKFRVSSSRFQVPDSQVPGFRFQDH